MHKGKYNRCDGYGDVSETEGSEMEREIITSSNYRPVFVAVTISLSVRFQRASLA